eukprot:gene2803-5518_t
MLGYILRCDNKDEWVSHIEQSKFEISSDGGIVIRQQKSNALQVDLPRTSIQHVELISNDLLLMSTAGNLRLAFKFMDCSECKSCTMLLNSKGVAIADGKKNRPDSKRHSTLFPDLEDPVIQELVLRMLFTEGFESFVDGIESLCAAYLDQITATTEKN